MERSASRPAAPAAHDRAQALQERVLALAGAARARPELDQLPPPQPLHDGSHEQAMALVALALRGTVARDMRLTDAGWLDVRTGELVP